MSYLTYPLKYLMDNQVDVVLFSSFTLEISVFVRLGGSTQSSISIAWIGS